MKAGRARGLVVASEIFADRTYSADGSLARRERRRTRFLEDEAACVAQVLRILNEGVVKATDGTEVLIEADTVCLHSDSPKAVCIPRGASRADLATAGIEVSPPVAL